MWAELTNDKIDTLYAGDSNWETGRLEVVERVVHIVNKVLHVYCMTCVNV